LDEKNKREAAKKEINKNGYVSLLRKLHFHRSDLFSWLPRRFQFVGGQLLIGDANSFAEYPLIGNRSNQ